MKTTTETPTSRTEVYRPVRSGRRSGARGIAVGLVGVVSVCAFTPYNDMVLGNTGLIGNYLPVGAVLYFLLVVLAVNAPISRWCPSLALGRREIAVAFAMTLVSCTIPAMGLMRLLPGTLVGIYHQAGEDPRAQQNLQKLALPDWIFPSFAAPAGDVAARANESVIRDYVARVGGGGGARSSTGWPECRGRPGDGRPWHGASSYCSSMGRL